MLGYISNMRFATIPEIKQNLDTYRSFFRRLGVNVRLSTIPELKQNLDTSQSFFWWLRVGILIFGLAWSLLLAHCMHQSVVMALEMWLLVLPIVYWMTTVHVALAKWLVAAHHRPLLSAPSPVECFAFQSLKSPFVPAVPTSPPRLCLASCEA